MKEGVTFILAVMLLLPPPCRGDAVCFVVKVKVLCLAFQMKYTTRNQWLSYIYNTVPEQYNANIRVCAAHFMEDYFLILGESSLQCEHYEWL